MKKQLLLFVMMLLPMVASAYDAYIDGIYFILKKDSKTAEVTYRDYSENNSSAYSGSVVIPSEIVYDEMTYQVDSIGWRAFSYCSELISISIPEGVKTIGGNAFLDCSNLKTITIPNSITTINSDAFTGTPLVENQPDGVVYIDKYVYKYKGSMPENTQIELDEGTLGIADCAFIDCNNLTSITTPSSLSFIGFCAFARCSNLTVAKFGSGLKMIGSSAFAECGSLFSVEIPNGVITIDGGAFQYCNSLTTVTVPNSVSYIGGSAFQGCSNLTSLAIPDGVSSIEEHTFYGCSNLAYVTIPQSVISIGNEAFYNCSSLANVNIPTNVTSIGYLAFYGCNNITSIVIPNGVTTIEDHTFYDCSSLSSVSIPNGITSIGRYAFAKCSSLKSIIIPPNVAYIGESAFMNCWGLETVNISDVSSWCKISFDNEYSNPTYYTKCLYVNESKLSVLKDLSNISKINKYVFINCIDITSASLPNDITIIGESAFSGCTKLAKIDLPEELKFIQKQAFTNCNELKELVIPSKVELIYQEAFSGCNNLDKVKTLSTTPPFLYDNSFSIFSVPLIVPKGCKEVYQSAQGWKNFTNISDADKYKLSYVVDNEEYKTYDIEEGSSITPEAAPTKEGYTFSGWSEIPQTMPAHDVTVTGTFSINKYKLTYTVDGTEYKTYEVEYGATITPEAAPAKEGYSFSGWSEIPETMPAHDLTVTGTFTINKYKLTYTVDGEEYKTYEVEYGATITPEAEPTKEGYTFSGWSEIPETMPAHDLTVTGTFTINKYKLTYIVDGAEYKTYEMEYGATITPEAAPTKEGYTFSGWSEIPETMPAHDVTVIGTFYKKGDANGDNTVNAADIVEMVNYIMGNPSEKFNNIAADINDDGVVNAADIVQIVNTIMKSE